MYKNNKKIAIVCDWLTDFGGAERVILAISEIYPNADVFTSVFGKKCLEFFDQRKVKSSFIQKIPFLKNHHRLVLSLMPFAFESFDLSDYDLVISSSHCCAKGIITKPSTLHVSYCHNPMRYAWDDFHSYIDGYRLPFILKPFIYHQLSKIRLWDRLSADRVDKFIANSNCVRKRIAKYYRRDSDVIYPPVNIRSSSLMGKRENFYLAVGRLIPYKRFDLLIDAANKLGFKLKIVGEGKEKSYLMNKFKGENVEFLGWVDQDRLNDLYSKTKAFLFPQLEDFGITALEAMSFGTPVIAYSQGGARETVIDGVTGVYFDEQNVESLEQAIDKMEKFDFDENVIMNHAKKFSLDNFKKSFESYISEEMEKFEKNNI